jgi:hypothetical protein
MANVSIKQQVVYVVLRNTFRVGTGRLVTNCVRQARGCAYHGWRSGWDHWSQFWLIVSNGLWVG